MKSDLTPPKEDIWDYLHKANKAVLSILPPAKEFYEMVINPPLQKRMIEWMSSVKKKCEEFEKQFENYKPENLRNNDEFIDLFFEVTERVKKTSDGHKIDRLRNFLLHSVIANDLKQNEKLELLRIIDWLDFVHIEILNFFVKEKYIMKDKENNVFPIQKKDNKFIGKKKEGVNLTNYLNIHSELEFAFFSKAELFFNSFLGQIQNQSRQKGLPSFRPFNLMSAFDELFRHKLIRIFNLNMVDEIQIPEGNTVFVIQVSVTAEKLFEYIKKN